MIKNSIKEKIGIIGLGYVGLPLAIEFSKKKRDVVGFDLNKNKINDLINKKYKFKKSDNLRLLSECQIIIVAVPTPIKKNKKPDLSYLKRACTDIGNNIKKNTTIIFESTVYPGCTEEFSIPLIEKISKLNANKDFFYGFSPERINPGDKLHTLPKINKIVSGSNKRTTLKIKKLYQEIIKSKVYITDSIKIAEAAKIIENTQRDINIALMNEFAIILNKLNIDTLKVLKAASTKWNFFPFYPGLVGGHCVGVDPYYLTYKSEKIGINPKIILAGRVINDNMPKYVFKEIKKICLKKKIKLKKSKILILGFSFKENCDDIRNTKVFDIISCFKRFESKIDIFDPLVDKFLLKKMYSLNLTNKLKTNYYDIIIYAVPHKLIKKIKLKKILNSAKKNNVFYDVKGVYSSNLTDGRL